MEQEALFKKQLTDLVKQAKKQGMCITQEQVAEAFPDFAKDETRLSLIYGYLAENNITVGDEADLDALLTGEEKDYLAEYLQEIQEFAVSAERRDEILRKAIGGPEEVRKEMQEEVLRIFLPVVVEVAKMYAGQGAYLADLIGEGNLALVDGITRLGEADNPQEAQGLLGQMMMEAMEGHIRELLDATEFDRQVADKINQVLETSQELAQTLMRKVTVAELAQETGMTEGEILEAVRLSGSQMNRIEHIEFIDES